MIRTLAAAAAILLASPALAAGSEGQTSDRNAPEGSQVKGYGYGTPSGTEANDTAGQASERHPKQRKQAKKAPQQEADHDSAQPNLHAGEQGQHAGPAAQAPAKHPAKKKAKRATPAQAPAPGDPTR